MSANFLKRMFKACSHFDSILNTSYIMPDSKFSISRKYYSSINLLGVILNCCVKQRVKYFGSLNPTS